MSYVQTVPFQYLVGGMVVWVRDDCTIGWSAYRFVPATRTVCQPTELDFKLEEQSLIGARAGCGTKLKTGIGLYGEGRFRRSISKLE